MSTSTTESSASIQLIASDLDGTLLTSRNNVSVRTQEAIQAAQREGILVVPATGRGSISAIRALESIPNLPWFITSNGAVIENTEESAKTTIRTISSEISQHAIDQLKSRSNDYTFAWLTSEGFGAEDKFRDLHSQFLSRRHVSMTPGFNPGNDDLIKVLIGGAHRDPKRLLASVIEDLDHLLHVEPVVTIAGSDAAFVEMTAFGVNKGTALELLSSQLGIDSNQIIAFGDQHNDLQMLEWAGHSVAMANAVASVQEQSTLQTKNNDEDGVAIIIEQILDGTLTRCADIGPTG